MAWPDRLLRIAVVAAVVGTALACSPGLLPSHAFRVPKLIALGLAGATAAVALAARARRGTTLTLVDAGLLGYLAAGVAASLLHGRLWSLGAGWGAQELAAVLLLWAASAIAQTPGGPAWLLRLLVATGAAIAALAIVEALGADLPLAGARPIATLGNRDWVATYLTLVLPIALVALAVRPSVRRAVVPALLVIAIVVTRCRGAWISVLVFLAGAGLVVAGAHLWHLRRRRGRTAPDRLLAPRGPLVALAVVAAAIALAVLVPWPGLRWTGPAPYWSSLERVTAVDEGTGRTRAVQLPVAAAIVAAHPLLGVGPGQWHDAFDQHAHAAADHHVEGAFGTPAPFAVLARIAAETGLLGLTGVVLAAAALLVHARRRWRAGLREPVVAAVAALAIAQVIGLSQPLLYQPETLVVLAVLAGSLRLAGRPAHASDPARPDDDDRPDDDHDRDRATPADHPHRTLRVPAALARAGLLAAAAFVVAITALIASAALPEDASPAAMRAAQRRFPSPQVAEHLVFTSTAQLTLGPGDRARCAAVAADLADALRWSPHHINLHYRAAHCARVDGDLGATRAWLRRILTLEPHARAQVEASAQALGVSL